ncbi:MAG: hypothetical protein ACYSTS_10550 [Planctomycetota bacterium]
MTLLLLYTYKAIRIILAAILIAMHVDMYDNIVFSKNTQEKSLIRRTWKGRVAILFIGNDGNDLI